MVRQSRSSFRVLAASALLMLASVVADARVGLAADDPLVAAKATALGHDPARIFAFVRDEIGFEPYFGYLRGPRGTLRSGAGNSLDRASLLGALLEASGFTDVTYAHGRLTGAQAQTLLLTVLAAPSRAFGCPNAAYDPRNDGDLQNQIADHYWVQADTGGGKQDLDPTTSTPGATLTSVLDTFTDIPTNLRHQVTVKVDAELYSQAAAAFALSGLNRTTVLTQVFDAADLAGRPLSVSAFVRSAAGGGIPFGVATNTYTPYILVGQGDGDVTDDPLIVGTTFQDILTNFPLGSQVTTGLFLSVDVQDPFRVPTHLERVLYDRIGYAARQGGAPVDVSGAAGPALTDFDVTTIAVEPGTVSLDDFGPQHDRLQRAHDALAALAPELSGITPGGPYTPDQVDVLRRLSSASRALAVVNAETLALGFEASADAADRQLARGYLVHPIVESPRVTLAISQKDGDGASLALDVQKNTVRIVPLPGQHPSTPFWFEVVRGLETSFLEGQVLTAVTGQPAASIAEVLAAASGTASNDFVVLTGDDVDVLAGLALSDEAKARIGVALAANHLVLTPTHMVTIGGRTTVGWLETDTTGHTISVFENGGHQALLEYGNALEFSEEFNKPIANFIGRVAAFGQVGILYTAAVLDAVADGGGFGGVVKTTKNSIEAAIKKAEAANKIFEKMEKAFEKLKLDTKGFGLVGQLADGLVKGFEFATKFFDWITPNDPPVFPFLVNDLGTGLPAVTPGATPGVAVSIVPDPFFTEPVDGTELPSVFVVRVQNTGPATATFDLSLPTPPPGFDVRLGMSSVRVDPGKTGEVSLCVVPQGGVGAPGSAADFHVKAASEDDAGVNDTHDGTATLPGVQGVALTVAPDTAVLPAGGAATMTIGLRATGNVGGSVAVAVDAPAGITVSGLTSPVALAAVDDVASETVQLHVDASVAPGAQLVVRVRADFGPADATQEVTATALVTVADASAECAGDAALVATTLGKGGLADVLRSLAGAENALAARPDGTVERSELATFLDKTIAQVTGVTVLAPVDTALLAARASLAAATPAEVPAVLASVNAALCTLNGILARADTHGIGAVLTPPSQEILPNTATTFTLNLQNNDSIRRTFDLALGPLPAGVTGHVSPTTVTLGPGEARYPPVTVTIDPIADALAPFDFTATVTDRLSPLSTQDVRGSLTVRAELVQVLDVTATPGFADPGGAVSVRVRLYNAVNVTRDANVYLGLRDPNGHDAMFPFFGGAVHLDVSANIQSLDIPVTLPAQIVPGPYSFYATAADGGTPIPGATGDGPFFVGTPLAAQITVTPAIAAPGDPTVQTTLTLQREATPNPQATVLGAVQTENGLPHSIVVDGTRAYVCGETGGSVVDVSDSTAPTIVGTFGPWDPSDQAGFSSVTCSLLGGHLFVGFSRGFAAGGSGIPLRVDEYALTDPAHPTLATPDPQSFPRGITGGPAFFDGAIGWVPSSIYVFNPFSNFIFRQAGDFFALDFTDPANIALRGRLFPPPSGDSDGTDLYAGHNNSMIFGAQRLSDTVAYLTSTTATGDGFGTGPGTGRLLVVDTTDPDAPAQTAELLWPTPGTAGSGPVLNQGIALDGTTALVVGDTAGYYDAVSGLVGKLTLSAVDASSPAAPAITSTLVTGLGDGNGTTAVALGDHVFAVAGGTFGAKPNLRNELLLVDATDPTSLRYVPYDVGANITSMQRVGELLYATSSLGLTIYEIGTVNGPRLTVRVRVPKAPGVTAVPGSFQPSPTATESQADADVYVFDQPATDTLTWQQVVHGLGVGETRAVVLGGAVEFVAPGFGSGTLTLPAAYVEGAQILAIDPSVRANVQVATPATYTLSVKNPTAADAVFTLGVAGIPDDWVTLAATVPVPAGQTVAVPLVVTPGLDAVPYLAYDFAVSASDGGPLRGDVYARLGTGPPPDIGGNPGAVTGGVLLDASPASAVAGRGDAAAFTLRLTNLGNLADTFQISPQLPPGWGLGFQPQSLPPVLSGASLSFQMFVVPPPDVAPGTSADVPIAVASYNGGQYGTKATVHVDVPGSAVSLAVLPFDGTLQTDFLLRVRNDGDAADTFDLALTGPLALAGSLDATSVAVDPHTSTDVPIRLGTPPPLPAGTVPLGASATSRTTPAITASAYARVAVGAQKALQATMVPDDEQRAGPGTGTFTVKIMNVGTVEDTYTASITDTTGGLQAALRGLTGDPGQSVPSVRLLPLATADVTLDATLDALGEGTVTVRVASVTDPTETADVTGHLHATVPTTTTTTLPRCGNGVIDPGEQCDPNASTETCTLPLICAAATCTCVPATFEICGDCIDNDGDGLTDFEDPTCCASANVVTLTLKKGRIKPVGTASKLALKTLLAQTTGLDPTHEDVYVQLRKADGGEVVCAKVPATSFVKKGNAYKFVDTHHQVLSAKGIDHLVLRTTKTGAGKLKTTGASVQFANPGEGSLVLTFGFRDPTAGDKANRCAASTQPFKATKKGALKFP